MEISMTKKDKNITRTMPMRVLDEKGIQYEVLLQSSKQHTAEGVAKDLNIPVAQVLKAMLVQCSTRPGDAGSPFILVVIPGDRRLSLKKIGAALADKKVQLASQRDVERVTGYQVGSVSVLGFRREDVPGFVDQHVLALKQVVISAGRPDVGLTLRSADLVQAIARSQMGDFCED
jgi:Cys-tRNA(Pro) deacylase